MCKVYGKKYAKEQFLGEKYVQEEFLGRESLGKRGYWSKVCTRGVSG